MLYFSMYVFFVLQVYGPSSDTPELGTAAAIQGLKQVSIVWRRTLAMGVDIYLTMAVSTKARENQG